LKTLKIHIILYFISFVNIGLSQNYRTIFGSDYENALSFCKINSTRFYQTANFFAIDTSLMVSVVFPEIVRYSYFKDFFETSALEIAYKLVGSDAADFSIGHFQMKPSFIEKMEEWFKMINQNPKYRFIYTYTESLPEKIREIRLMRLKNLQWQMNYLACFVLITDYRFSNKNWQSQSAKIKFYASAYNSGFYIDEKIIQHNITKKCFPFGFKSSPDDQYSYCEVSNDFYYHYYRLIFQKK